MSLSTNPLLSHYIKNILMANDIEVESVVFGRDGGSHYSYSYARLPLSAFQSPNTLNCRVPISRELGKIKRKLFQESREIGVHLSPDLVHPNVDPNDLEQVAVSSRSAIPWG